ncbi:MAG: hypothetical protein HKN10_01815 [Myxococcales bacterium]|nr:hypothetical protein [Myxococcales bacterium]
MRAVRVVVTRVVFVCVRIVQGRLGLNDNTDSMLEHESSAAVRTKRQDPDRHQDQPRERPSCRGVLTIAERGCSEHRDQPKPRGGEHEITMYVHELVPG